MGLVLAAAVLHPTWNLIARRATLGDPIAFVWLTSALSAALYLPVIGLAAALRPIVLHDLRRDVFMIAGTGALHVVYFVVLQRGYRAGDFSLVYPLARGTGPVVTALVAGALFSERLGIVGLAGVAIIVAAIFVVTGRSRRNAPRVATSSMRASVVYVVATGVTIAAYSLWDKDAVAVVAIAPLVYDFGRTAAQTLILAPIVGASATRRRAVARAWRSYRREAFGVAVLSPAAYVLILYALQTAPVSLVAPIRESSIVLGAFFGAQVLREGQLRRRIVAALLMFAGIVILARR